MLAKQGTKVDKVLNFEIADSILEERITGRWVHPGSGRSYHYKFNPPQTKGLDDVRAKMQPVLDMWFQIFTEAVCIS